MPRASLSISVAAALLAAACAGPTAPTPVPTTTLPDVGVTPPPTLPASTPPALTVWFSGWPAPLYSGQMARYYASADHVTGSVVQWTWAFGDGSQMTTPTGIIDHVYAQPGRYAASVTAMDTAGNRADGTTTFTVVAPIVPAQPPPPLPAILVIGVACASTGSLTGSCTVTAAIGGTPVTSQIAQTVFEWGDGATDTVAGTTPTGVTHAHTYTTKGSYLVVVTVTLANGTNQRGGNYLGVAP